MKADNIQNDKTKQEPARESALIQETPPEPEARQRDGAAQQTPQAAATETAATETATSEPATTETAAPQTVGQKAAAYFKGLPRRWFIEAFTGMAHGLFVTLIIGTILKTIGGQIIGDNTVGRLFVLFGNVASVLMGAGIGAGIAHRLKAPALVMLSAIAAGFIGAYAEQMIGATVAYNSMSVRLDGSLEGLALSLAAGKPGNPISAYVCSLMATEIGFLVAGKTRLDILIVPITCVLGAFLGCFVSLPFIYLIALLSRGIAIATGAVPFVMGVVIAVAMGMLLTLPTSSAAIWVAIASAPAQGMEYNMYLAGGAAVVGCACHMVGFAVMSFKENGWGGLVSQGLGTSMLQIPNVMKKPILFLPPVIASAVCGPLATCAFKLLCNASGGGMGTSGLVGLFGTIALAPQQNPALMWSGIVLLMFVLPAAICWILSYFMRKRGLIRPGDLKI